MIIRDLKNYIQKETDSDIDYGREVELATSKDKFLAGFYGKINSKEELVNNVLKNLASFAEDSFDQVFYEFLQNAKDSNSTGFWAFLEPEYGIILLNDGEPFHTIPENYGGSLFSFLGKAKTDKYKDPNKSGKKGMGSKLMYNLLISQSKENLDLKGRSEKLAEILSRDLTAPILFSWSRSQLAGLRELLEIRDVSEFTSKDDDSAIFCKLFLSYFPALPGEKLRFDGKQIVPFDQRDFLTFQKCLTRALDVFKSDEIFMSPGSLVYIPAPSATIERLRDELEQIEVGLAQSLSVLAIDKEKINLRRININGKKLNKEELISLPISVSDSNKKIINAEIVFSKNRNDAQKDLPNIFTDYFPISMEKHGLGYLLKCKDFDVVDNRQKIRDESNKLDAFADEIIQSWINIPFEKRIPFIGHLAISASKATGVMSGFQEKVSNFAKEHIPTNSQVSPYGSSENTFILPNGFEKLDTSSLLDEQYPLHQALYEYYEEGLENWGVSEATISDLFFVAGIEKSREYFRSNGTAKFLRQIEVENDSQKIYQIPFIPCGDNYLSLEEFCDQEDTFLMFPQLLFGNFRERCEKEGLSIKFSRDLSVFDLHQFPNIKTVFSEYWDTDKIFERVNAFLESGEIQFSQKLKNLILSILHDAYPAKFAEWFQKEYSFFSNVKGDEKLLISQTISDSFGLDFFGDWKLPTSQVLSFFKDFQAYKSSVWEVVFSDRKYFLEKINSLKAVNEIISVLGIVLKIYSDRSDQASKPLQITSDDKLVYTQNDQWETFSSSFFLPAFKTLTVQEFDLINTFLSNQNVNLPSKDLIDIYRAKEFKSFFANRNLQDLEFEWQAVNESEILCFKKLSDACKDVFFEIFNVKKSADGKHLISTGKTIQFINAPSEAADYLEANGGYLRLSESLQSIFTIADGLYNAKAETFVGKILQEFGAQREFLSLVVSASHELKVQYLKLLPQIEINSSATTKLAIDSFEIRLINSFSKYEDLFRLIKSKIFVDGQSISHDGFRDDIFLNSHSYSLSTLLEKEYSGASNRLSKANLIFSELSEATRDQLFGLGEIEHKVLLEKILSLPQSKPIHACFLIDYLEANEDVENTLSDLPSFDNLQVIEILEEFKDRKINWKKYWKGYYGFKPKRQIIPQDKSLWLKEELVSETLQKWANGNSENHEFLSNNLTSQHLTESTEIIRNNIRNGNSIEDLRLPPTMVKASLDWIIKNEVLLNESQGKRIWGLIDENSLWDEYLLPYSKWGETETRKLGLTKKLEEIKYYFHPNSKIEYLTDTELVPKAVVIFPGDLKSEVRKKIVKKHGLSLLTIETRIDGEIREKIEWNESYYNKWKDSTENNFRYRIHLLKDAVNSSAFIVKDGEVFLEIGQPRPERRFKEVSKIENRLRNLYIFPERGENITLKYLEEWQSELFETQREIQDLVRLFSIANQVQEDALRELKDQGIIGEDFQILKHPSSGSTPIAGTGNVYLEGLESLPDPSLLKKNWNLIKQLIEKFGKDLGAKLQEALENESDDSKPNKLSGFIGEQLAREWFERKYQNDAKWLGDSYLAYDITLGKHDLIEIKTKINTLYDESVGGSGTTAIYLRKSQLSFIEELRDTQYYLGLISLEDLGIKDVYYEWLEIWGREVEIQESLQIQIKDFAKRFMEDEAKMSMFSEFFRFIFMKNGKDQVSET